MLHVGGRQAVWHQTPKKETSLTQYVLMSHQDGLVDLSLSEPTGLLSGEENFHSHFFSPPPAHPHLSIPSLAYLLHHLNLLGYRSLHLRRSKKWEKVKCWLSRWTDLCLSCNLGISPIEGALSLSQSFATALLSPSEILQGECKSHPAPGQYCTEDETLGACICKTT